MTSVENERLAIVETEVRNLKGTVDEVKVAVTGFDGKLDGVLLYIAGEKGGRAERRRESQLIRWALSIGIPTVISILGYVAGKLT